MPALLGLPESKGFEFGRCIPQLVEYIFKPVHRCAQEKIKNICLDAQTKIDSMQQRAHKKISGAKKIEFIG